MTGAMFTVGIAAACCVGIVIAEPNCAAMPKEECGTCHWDPHAMMCVDPHHGDNATAIDHCTASTAAECGECEWNTKTGACENPHEDPCHLHTSTEDCEANTLCEWQKATNHCHEKPLTEICATAKVESGCTALKNCMWSHLRCQANRTSVCQDLNPYACVEDSELCAFTKTGCGAAPVEVECHAIVSVKECVLFMEKCKWRDGKCDEKGEEECHEEEDHVKFYLVTVVITLAFWGARAVQKLNWSGLSESGGVIITGAVIGFVVFIIEKLSGGNYDQLIEFDEEVFTLFILPPIIFEAGFTLEHKGVMRNLGTILLYAVFGTLISSLIIGMMVYFCAGFAFPALNDHVSAPFISLAFGALLSAVDPVAVIAVLGQKFDLTNPPLLYNIVFGEAVLNDAVSIVLYNVMVKFVKTEMSAGALGLAVVDFVRISFLSCLVGYAYGAICALSLKHINFKHHPSIEIIMLGSFALGSYYLAETLHLSGIMSLFICARIEGHHAMFNLSQEARESAIFIFKTLAHLAETYVFVLLGEAFWAHSHSWQPVFIIVSYLAMLLARALNVFPMSFLANLNRKRQRITGSMQFFMWFSGLRGAIAFGLALLTLSKAKKYTGTEPDKVITVEIAQVFVSTTLIMVVITVLIMGGFTEMLLSKLGLTDDSKSPSHPTNDAELALMAQGENESPFGYQEQTDEAPERNEKESKALMRRIARWDDSHIAPILRSEVMHVSHVHPHEMHPMDPSLKVVDATGPEPEAPSYDPPASPLIPPEGNDVPYASADDVEPFRVSQTAE